MVLSIAPTVPLRMIANFKRVKALTKELTVVAEALRSSSLLSLDAEGTRVRRAAPLPAFDVGDITRRTVVVEHLPDKPTIGERERASSAAFPADLSCTCTYGASV